MRESAGDQTVKRLFSTDDVNPQDRFTYWHETACKSIVEHESRPHCRETFGANIQADLLADMGLVLFENSPMEVARKPHHIANARTDELFACRQVAGELALEQEGRETLLRTGSVVLLDPMLPYAGRFSSGSKLLVLKVPRRLLEARVGKTRDLLCRAVMPSEGEHALASSFFALLPEHAGQIGPTGADVVMNLAIDLLSVSLAKMTQHQPRISSGRRLVLLNVRAAVEARLRDPGLNPETVAAAAGVSVRYANGVLKQESLSIGRLILERRLARCQRSLEDPRQAHRSVSEIAYGWGFSNLTYFGRMFRKAFGFSPREYRRHINDDTALKPD
jgi:AraC family transcriptional activator of tynA and feaB